jgi:NitT/TauT family transport system ATP-binding protein
MASAEADTAAIALQGIGKSFRNGVEALAGIELAVAPGDFVTLLGPSGCGKSTLLRIIAGLIEPSCGEIFYRDDLLRRVGFVFQEPTLMPWATAWNNVYLPLRLAGERRRAVASRVSGALESVGLGGFAKAYPRQLSGGMRMRVSIARALVTDPQLLLLDEPFAALDEFTRFRLNEDLLRLWQARRCTVVFVTHSVFEAVFLSSRIVIMTPRPGRIVADCAIDLPYPRARELRTSPEYAAYCRRVSRLLDNVA